jgi:type I restriction enzyme M protein
MASGGRPRKGYGSIGVANQNGSVHSPTSTRPAATIQPLDARALEHWLWSAACSIRGAVDAPKFKDYILPLVFVKRLSDVFDDELVRLKDHLGDEATARELVAQDRGLVRFYVPDSAKWSEIRRLSANVGERVTSAMRLLARENPKLQGVIDAVDFNATVAGQRVLDDARLQNLIETLSDLRYRLGLNDVEPDILGRAYEYLIRKFAEGQGQSAGEFFTPKEVGWVIARIVNPMQGESVYDPACGSSGLLVKCELLLKERREAIARPLRLFGQELIPVTYAMSRMNMIVHDMEGEIAIGDTLRNPKFIEDSSLRKFDVVVANPMWNQDGYDNGFYENDPQRRFEFGYPSAGSADWGWLQHILASMNDGARAAVILDTGAVTRGSGSEGTSKEKDIRREFVQRDLIEGVILLPENLFYNTTGPGVIIVLNNAKSGPRAGKVLVIDATDEFEKGRPKNFITDQGIARISDTFANFREVDGFSRILVRDELEAEDFNLSPSRYIAAPAGPAIPPLSEALRALASAEKARAEAEEKLDRELVELGYPGWRDGS